MCEEEIRYMKRKTRCVEGTRCVRRETRCGRRKCEKTMYVKRKDRHVRRKLDVL